MDQLIDEKWDQRHWEVALRSDKPVETYTAIKSDIKSQKDSVSVDDLSKEQRDWLRST